MAYRTGRRWARKDSHPVRVPSSIDGCLEGAETADCAQIFDVRKFLFVPKREVEYIHQGGDMATGGFQ